MAARESTLSAAKDNSILSIRRRLQHCESRDGLFFPYQSWRWHTTLPRQMEKGDFALYREEDTTVKASHARPARHEQRF
jgi:hypothetical protein